MNTTHFVIMNQMNTTNMINQMNMMHIMHNHNTPGTVCTLTGMDVVIMIVGLILLLWGGVKVTEWLLEKTYKMKDPMGSIVFVVGMFGYVIVGVTVISLFMYLI